MTLSEFEKMVIDKLDDLCNRMTAIEVKWDTHIKNVTKQERTKREVIYITIAASSAIIAIYQSFLS